MHLLNVIGGVAPVAAVFQFLNTVLVGSVFLLAAVATRSLLWPMLGHAIYDWAVVDGTRYVEAGAPSLGLAAVTVIALLAGACSLWMLWRTREHAAFADDAAPRSA